MSILRVVLLGVLLLGASAARAQTPECRTALAEAEARYVEGAFDAVPARLEPCLDGSRQAIPAYRLVALSQLRRGEIVETKLTILRILTLQPGYLPDRIQDPPTFVALVETVRGELESYSQAALETALVARGPWIRLDALPHRAEPAPPIVPRADVEAPAPVPIKTAAPFPTVAFRAWGGMGSYGGERGTNASTSLGEFTENAGPSGGVGVEVTFQPWAAVYGTVEASRFPTLTTLKGPNEVFEPVSSFSEWVQFMTVGARLRSPTVWRIGVVGSVGGGVAFGRRDGTIHTGGTLTAGGGIEMTLSRANHVFVEGHGTLVGPARAIDGASIASEPFDLFSSVRLGVRTRLR